LLALPVWCWPVTEGLVPTFHRRDQGAVLAVLAEPAVWAERGLRDHWAVHALIPVVMEDAAALATTSLR
jgi:hypothetical protein